MENVEHVENEETWEEYMNKLREWIYEYRRHSQEAFINWCTFNAALHEEFIQEVFNRTSNTGVPAGQPQRQQPGVQPQPQQPGVQPQPQQPGIQPQQHLPQQIRQWQQQEAFFNTGNSFIFHVAPMWKRLVAEGIDFMILFILKLLLTMAVLESFDIVDFEGYTLNAFEKKLQNPTFAIQMSREILMLETIHRFLVCCYETYWLTVQCATPGKHFMGLAVIQTVLVTSMRDQPEEIVIAHHCSRLSIKNAIVRSLLKSIFVALFLPIFFFLMFFKYNRTGYDLLSNSLVVEYNRNIPLQGAR